MKYLLCVCVLMLSACASKPPPPEPTSITLKGYNGPYALDRANVVSGARDCINGRMKPEIQYVTQRTSSGVVLVPVEVLCIPYASR